MQNIYVLNLLCVEEITDENLKEDLKLENFKFNREITFERYKERILSWNKFSSKYKLTCVEENAYFLNLFDAQYSAKTNCADINEAGVYNYVCIIAYPIGLMYANCEPEEFYLYRYNRESDEYVEVDSTEDVYKFVAIDMGANSLIPSYKEDGFNLFKNVTSNISSLVNKCHSDIVNDVYIFMYHFGLVFDCLKLDASKYKPFNLSLSDEKDGVSLNWYIDNNIYHFVFVPKEDESYCIMSWIKDGKTYSEKMKMEKKDYAYISMKVLLKVKENEK